MNGDTASYLNLITLSCVIDYVIADRVNTEGCMRCNRSVPFSELNATRPTTRWEIYHMGLCARTLCILQIIATMIVAKATVYEPRHKNPVAESDIAHMTESNRKHTRTASFPHPLSL